MKKFVEVIFIVLLFAVGFYYREELAALVAPLFAPAPCTQPIPYNLGTFDKKFNISEAYFLSALSDAEAIWEKPTGKNLFAYEPKDTDPNVLKLNLVYDYRQDATKKLASLGIAVQNTKASYDELKSKFLSLKAEYEALQSAFKSHVEDFKQRQQAYEDEVTSWNKKGGAPKADYDRLQRTRAELDAEAKELELEQANLNNKGDEVNALVVTLNNLADTLNLSVEKYNTTNSARGESFEEGVYSNDGVNREIDIYEFTNRDKLVRVLAHELGHALGLEHVSDPKAIMYSYNQGTSEKLTQADIDELKLECKLK